MKKNNIRCKKVGKLNEALYSDKRPEFLQHKAKIANHIKFIESDFKRLEVCVDNGYVKDVLHDMKDSVTGVIMDMWNALRMVAKMHDGNNAGAVTENLSYVDLDGSEESILLNKFKEKVEELGYEVTMFKYIDVVLIPFYEKYDIPCPIEYYLDDMLKNTDDIEDIFMVIDNLTYDDVWNYYSDFIDVDWFIKNWIIPYRDYIDNDVLTKRRR